jgi:hypothetical protein
VRRLRDGVERRVNAQLALPAEDEAARRMDGRSMSRRPAES